MKNKEEPKCVMGCKAFSGREVKHHKDCPNYPDSLSKYYDDIASLSKWIDVKTYTEDEVIAIAETVRDTAAWRVQVDNMECGEDATINRDLALSLDVRRFLK